MTENTSLLKKSFEDKFYDFACFEQILPSSAYMFLFYFRSLLTLYSLWPNVFFPLQKNIQVMGLVGHYLVNSRVVQPLYC